MQHYCTYFDQHYAARGIALAESLRIHAGDFRLWVLCLDTATVDILNGLALPNIHPIAVADIEHFYPELATVKDTRSRFEFYLTCTPFLPSYLFATQTDIA